MRRLLFVVLGLTTSLCSCEQEHEDVTTLEPTELQQFFESQEKMNHKLSEERKGGNVFTFVQLTDTHGSYEDIIAANEYTDFFDCDFSVISGDILPNEEFVDTMNASRVPFYAIPGNHDPWEGYGQYGFRREFLNQLKSRPVYANEIDNYWYQDIIKYGKVLRVIGIDQFQNEEIGVLNCNYAHMDQAQIDWLIDLLEVSSDVDGIIMIVHMGFGNDVKGVRNQNNSNRFISTLANNYTQGYFHYKTLDPYLIPEIIEAYTSGENIIDKTYLCGGGGSLTVTTDFQKPSNNFIAYFGGHAHFDMVEYLEDFPGQLICIMPYCGTGLGGNYQYNDLIRNTNGFDCFNFNVNFIDFDNRKLTIERIGARNTISGVVRDTIGFSF